MKKLKYVNNEINRNGIISFKKKLELAFGEKIELHDLLMTIAKIKENDSRS